MATYRLGDKTPVLPAGERYWIAPSAEVIGDVHLGEDASIWFGAVARADNEPMIIGARSNIQDGAVLHSDPGSPLVIGCDVTVGHKAVLHGCTVGDGSLIGIGAVVLNGAVIGADSIVGAGALVPEGKVFPDGVLLLGQPARVARDLTPEQIGQLRHSAAHYVRNGRRFRRDLVVSK
ncbi:gamma carbonic anhydrase family protein [Asticcacaulis sp. EMRT-3]|uniref:gamma carbonic anhydrase family protein n=1 Tax=Asticcacaulis sp. EMRT-3 TaxID=3040349 RepID=UPI0024AED56B|nr:gamma carbonic anhydrase family protein [Asticcacaulis sp. EMRT-3]MDI7774189.1 gamma carbonic anhydrase family protein [Asticcacaulis sp. EMRT-3]